MILNGLPWTWTDHSVIFETAPKYCILDSFVDYEGHSISSKRPLPTVVDIRAVTPQETDPDLPVSIQESLVEAGLAVACCRVGGAECSSALMGPFEGGHHCLHHLHHSWV